MGKYDSILRKNALFEGIEEQHIPAVLPILSAWVRR